MEILHYETQADKIASKMGVFKEKKLLLMLKIFLSLEVKKKNELHLIEVKRQRKQQLEIANELTNSSDDLSSDEVNDFPQ